MYVAGSAIFRPLCVSAGHSQHVFYRRGADHREISVPDARESLAAFAADEEEIAPPEEFERDVGERLPPLGAVGATGVIDEHEVAIAQQCAVHVPGIALVLSSGEHD